MAGVQIGTATKQLWSKTFPDRVYRPAGGSLDTFLFEKNRLGE